MNTVKVKDADLRKAAGEGMDEFIGVFTAAIMSSAGGELTAESMAGLTAEQITLMAYVTLRDEVMDGGFVQLIYNGYGGFIFRNPFGKVMRLWGLDELATLINRGKKLYFKHRDMIEREYTDEGFAALYEQLPDFDDLDDTFVENEEEWTAMIARYVDGHTDSFAEVVSD